MHSIKSNINSDLWRSKNQKQGAAGAFYFIYLFIYFWKPPGVRIYHIEEKLAIF